MLEQPLARRFESDALATRALRLLQLLPSGLISCWCDASDIDLSAVADALVVHMGGTRTTDAMHADLILLNKTPDRPEYLPAATTLIFGGGSYPPAWRDTLAARRNPAWFIDDSKECEVDLFAVSASDDGKTICLAPFMVVDERGRSQPPGLFGEFALPIETRAKRTGVWGKRLASGRVSVADYRTRIVRIGGIWVNTDALAAQLRTLSGIREALVIARRDEHSQNHIVVYWSWQSARKRPDILTFFATPVYAEIVPILVEVPAIPRNRAGVPDLSGIVSLPIIDLVERARAEGLALSGGVPSVEASCRLEVAPMKPVADHAVTPSRSVITADSRIHDTPPDDRPAELTGAALVLPDGYPRSLAALLDRAAATQPQKGILCIDGVQTSTVSYQQLRERARIIAGWMQAQKWVPGDRIILRISALEALLSWFWAAQYVGLCVCVLGKTADARRDRETLEAAARGMQASAVICDDAACEPTLNGLPIWSTTTNPIGEYRATHIDSGAPALLLLTSGSSAEPKLVSQTHTALIAQGYASSAQLALTPADVSMNWMPLDHVGGLVMFHLRDMHVACSQLQVSRDFVLADPLRWLSLMSEHRVSISWSPHFGYALLENCAQERSPHQCALQAVRYLINGGEMVVAESARRVMDYLSQYGLAPNCMVPAWGMSETCSLVTANLDGDLRPNSATGAVCVGLPVAGIDVRVVNDTRTPVLRGQIGHLEVRGPSVFDGYWGDAGVDKSADPWFRTGDLALIEHRGLAIVGRSKDVVIINGVNFSCAQIERELQGVAAVDSAHTCVVAHRAPESQTDQVVVFVVPKEPARVDEVGEAVRSRLIERLQLQCSVVAVTPAQIPRTQIGKPQRALLQQHLQAGAFNDVLARQSARTTRIGLPPWFCVPIWRLSARMPAARAVPQRWAISGASPVLFQELKEQLETHGVVAVEPFDQVPADQHYDALLIVIDGPLDGEAEVDTAVLRRLQACAEHVSRVAVVVLSRCTLGDDARLSPLAAIRVGAIKGMWHSFAQESPPQLLRWVDVASDTSWRSALDSTLAELQSADDSCVVRLRNSERLVPGVQSEMFLASDTNSSLTRGGTYLVVGALGDLGLLLCKHLMRNWNARIVGVVRPRLDTATVAKDLALVEQLNRFGTFELLNADIGVPGSLAAAISGRFGAEFEIDGAFHAAGTFSVQPITQLNVESYRNELKTKGVGTLCLVDLLRQFGKHNPLLVVYGSVNGEFGGTGAAAYSAACAAQQSICAQLSRESWIRCHYIGWSQWRDLGLSRHNPLAGLVSRRGFFNIEPEEGLRSLERALASNQSNILIGIDTTHPDIVAKIVAPVYSFKLQLKASMTESCAWNPPAGGIDRFGRSYEIGLELVMDDGFIDAHAPNYRTFEALLIKLWCEILERTDIQTRQNFFEVGGNSLRLLQLKGRLEQALNRSIEVSTLFQHPTIQQLSLHMAQWENSSDDATQAATPDKAVLRARQRRAARNRR